ncbi:hypothetical protein AJ87_41145 [Rhizobium yanglingense]|nr:hypothetical protein AJ87_41145 [Rhizobium yanglingense]
MRLVAAMDEEPYVACLRAKEVEIHMLQNETKRHFETRDLKGDAEKAQKKAYRVISKDAAKRKARHNLFLLVALIALLLLLTWMLGGI